MARYAALALLFSLLGSGPAPAEELLFEGTLSLKGFGDPAPVGTAIGVATVNGSGSAGGHVSTLRLPGGLFTLMSTSTPTITTTISQVVVSLTPGAGTFSGGATGPLSGVLPVAGNVRVCLLVPGCGFSVDVPLTENGTRGVGIGGSVTTTFLGVATLTIMGSNWADVTRSLVTTSGTVTTPGFAHGPLSATSSTAQTDGVIRLNSPVPLAFTSGGAPPIVFPLFATLEVRFLPEPGAFLMLATGAAALVLVGWRRMRR